MMDDMTAYWQGRSRISRRRAIAGAGVVAGGVALAACGSKPQSAASSSGAQATPRSGGTINVQQNSEPISMDPSTKVAASAMSTIPLCDSLLAFKSGPSVKYSDLQIGPSLAEKWETPDPQTYIYHLRNGIKWQNLAPVNGRAFDASDVKWTYQYMSRTGPMTNLTPAPSASMFSTIDRIDTPDSSTVSVHFGEPFVPFLGYSASQWIPILPHEIFDADGDFKLRMVGTGPFSFDAEGSQTGTKRHYKKNPSYWNQGRPYVDEVNQLILSDQPTVNSAFQTGRIDILDYSGLEGRTVDALQKSVPTASVYQYVDSNNAYYIYFNITKPPMTDDRVRKAISFGIDRDELIKTLFDGNGQWSMAGAAGGMFTQDEIKQVLKYDPAQAKQLLAAAGYPNGLDIEFIWNAAYGDSFTTKAQLLQSQLKKVGVNLSLKPLQGNEDALRRRSGDFVFNITPRGQGISADIDSYVYGMFHPNSADNYGRINDPQLNPLLEAQRRELDPQKRTEIVKQAARRINDVPWALTLFYGPGYVMTQQRLKNYAPNVAFSYGQVVWNSWVQG
jgi:peptide/nickel transport system substrate-binding protein